MVGLSFLSLDSSARKQVIAKSKTMTKYGIIQQDPSESYFIVLVIYSKLTSKSLNDPFRSNMGTT